MGPARSVQLRELACKHAQGLHAHRLHQHPTVQISSAPVYAFAQDCVQLRPMTSYMYKRLCSRCLTRTQVKAG